MAWHHSADVGIFRTFHSEPELEESQPDPARRPTTKDMGSLSSLPTVIPKLASFPPTGDVSSFVLLETGSWGVKLEAPHRLVIYSAHVTGWGEPI